MTLNCDNLLTKIVHVKAQKFSRQRTLTSAALLVLNQQQINLFGQIQTSQTGDQLYSDTWPNEVSECSLVKKVLI